jgi:hypothetical protein
MYSVIEIAYHAPNKLLAFILTDNHRSQQLINPLVYLLAEFKGCLKGFSIDCNSDQLLVAVSLPAAKQEKCNYQFFSYFN